MAWSFQIVESVSGLSVDRVHPDGGRWRKQINGVGSGSHTFTLRGELHARGRDYWRDLFVEERRTLVVSWDGVAVYAGRINGTDWDADAGVLTVQHEEAPRGLLAYRHAHSIAGFGRNGKTTYSGLSLPGIARAIVMQGFSTPVTQRNMKVDFGPALPGSQSREWEWIKFPTLEAMLTEVQDLEDGPDVAFEPEWRADGLWFRLLLGNPHIEGDTVELVRGVAQSPVTGYRHKRDSKKQLTGLFGLGEGQGQERLIATDEVATTPDMPVREASEAFVNVSSQSVLQAQTAGLISAYSSPSSQDFYRVQMGEEFGADQFRLGGIMRLAVPSDEWMESQWREGRLVAVEGDMTDSLTLGVV